MILAALGMTFSTILEIKQTPAVLLSTAIAVAYTVRGGLWAVAWTDALQFFFMAGGLCLAIPFLLDHVGGLSHVWTAYHEQLGANAALVPPAAAFQFPNWHESWGWGWLDTALLLIFGGIPWHVYFQRVLACKTERTAVAFSVCAGFLCLAMSLPPALVGAIGRTVDWSQAPVGPPENAAMILPYLLRNLTPPLVAAVGLGAIAAAVMSSIDSSFLSASSMFVWNVYRPIFRPAAGHAEIRLMVRLAILAAGSAAASLALATTSIYSLWVLCSDLIYVILFPQLVCALFVRWTNAAGAMAGGVHRFGPPRGRGRADAGHPRALAFADRQPARVLRLPLSHDGHAGRMAGAVGRLPIDANGFPAAEPGRTIDGRSPSPARLARMSDPAPPIYSAQQKLLAYAVHTYTAMGLLCGALIAADILQQNYRRAFILMIVAVLIDATDGTFARKFRVKDVVPHIDGRKLDDIVDYLNYTFLPLLMVGSADWLPSPTWLWASVPLVASVFAFVHTGAKEETNGFFLGFPSYWNVFAFYTAVWLSGFGQGTVLAIALVLSGLSVLPLRFVYPNRARGGGRCSSAGRSAGWRSSA